MVFLGSRGWDPSITKSLSFRFHGRIWTCHPQSQQVFSMLVSRRSVEKAYSLFVCVCSYWPACLWWWGWTRRGTACRPPRCRRQSKPALSSHPGTAGRRSLHEIQQSYSGGRGHAVHVGIVRSDYCDWTQPTAFTVGRHELLQLDSETDKQSTHRCFGPRYCQIILIDYRTVLCLWNVQYK